MNQQLGISFSLGDLVGLRGDTDASDAFGIVIDVNPDGSKPFDRAWRNELRLATWTYAVYWFDLRQTIAHRHGEGLVPV